MIEITVKTLDSQNHAFTLEDDQITVRGFKEHIAESVGVAAESQRLIYCGRVLQDDKKLNDYDVNGKVIHLVYRPPPQPGQRNNDDAQPQNQGHSQTHGHNVVGFAWASPGAQRLNFHHTRHGDQMYGNAVYVPLPMPVSTEVVEGSDSNVVQLSNTLSNSRLIVARRMLDHVNNIIDRLDDPSQSQHQETEQEENQESAPSDQGATSDANTETRGRTPPQLPRPEQMSALLGQLLTTQQRLTPHIEQYRAVMFADSVLTPDLLEARGVESNQRIIDGVSTCLHYMSHACHALSDIIVDMGQQPPRNLRCRPIIIQHSAILQAGIPIQVEAHISLHGRNAASTNNGTESANNGNSAQPAANPTEPTQQNASNATDSNTQERTENAAQPQGDQPQQQQQQESTRNPFEAVFSLPNNVEVVMEESPESNMETAPGAEQNQNNESSTNATPGRGTGNTSERFPWDMAPPLPSQFLRNLVRAVAGQVVQGSIATTQGDATPITIGGSQTIAISIDSTNTNAGQSTQARSNMGTHPTTATQTRSTSRPHHHAPHAVFHQHASPLGWTSMNQSLDFDPFLPCNSHHVRPTPTTTANTTSTASQPTQSNSAPTTEQSNQQPRTATWSYTVRNNGSTTTSTTPPTSQASNANNSFLNWIHDVLGNASEQPQASISINTSGSDLAQSLGNIMQMLTGGNVQVGFVEPGGNPITGESTIADILESGGFGADLPTQPTGRQEDFLLDLSVLLVQNITSEGLLRISLGQYDGLASLRRPLSVFFLQSFPDAPNPAAIQEQVAERFLSVLRPYLQHILAAEEDNNSRSGSRIDICATVESILRQHIKSIVKLIFDNEVDDARFGQQMLPIANSLGRQLCIVLRYCLRGGQAGLEAVELRFVTGLLGNVHPALRQLIFNSFVVNSRLYSTRIVQPPDSEILPLLVYKDVPTQSSSAPSAVRINQPPQPQVEPEPMETEVVEEKSQNNEASLEDGEEIPETFPGHESLPPDWVPIIARDSVRQRRQLQMQGMANGGVTTFSDAYLGGLPSKRRKLIEQQKPRLLASPTPNHSTITASMERLVKEGVMRAGVEEVEGAAIAVAADPGVRRAFGQAIRDCINPHRYGTPDFPDPLRFPNATKYFADHERPPK